MHGAYIADTDNLTKKKRVQALVSALSNYAKEIGYAVDVPRDFWGPDQWPFENFVADRSDKKIIARDDLSHQILTTDVISD